MDPSRDGPLSTDLSCGRRLLRRTTSEATVLVADRSCGRPLPRRTAPATAPATSRSQPTSPVAGGFCAERRLRRPFLPSAPPATAPSRVVTAVHSWPLLRPAVRTTGPPLGDRPVSPSTPPSMAAVSPPTPVTPEVPPYRWGAWAGAPLDWWDWCGKGLLSVAGARLPSETGSARSRGRRAVSGEA
jgi:hypothetical protein